MPTGTCALCGATGVELIDSHIVSRWIYGRTIDYDPGSGSNLVSIHDGKSILSGKQEKKYLLCRPCENILGDSESYVAQIGLQADGTFPALKNTPVIERDPDFEGGDASALNVQKISHFAASIFWRADVAQIEPLVDLGTDREAIRQYLLHQAPFPSALYLVATLLRPASGALRVDQVIEFPVSDDDGSWHVFTSSGIEFRLVTAASDMGSELKDVSLPTTGRVFILEGRGLQEHLIKQVKSSTPVGSLAKRRGK